MGLLRASSSYSSAPRAFLRRRRSFRERDTLIEGFAADSSATSYVKISATDGEQTISVVVEGIKVAMAGAVLVPAQKILEILKRTPTDSVKLEVLGNSATLRSGRAQWTVQTPTGDSLPPTPDISDIELHSVGRKPLLRGLEVARKAVAGTAARPALMQAQVRDGRLRLPMVAACTDSV